MTYCTAAFKRLTQVAVQRGQPQAVALLDRSVATILETLANFESWAMTNDFDDTVEHKVDKREPPPPVDEELVDNGVPISYRPDLELKVRWWSVVGLCCFDGSGGSGGRNICALG